VASWSSPRGRPHGLPRKAPLRAFRLRAAVALEAPLLSDLRRVRARPRMLISHQRSRVGCESAGSYI
jgi:hypothetical protein